MTIQDGAMALFCSDVREEKTGAVTLVGVYPDNLDVTEFPSAIPALWVYVRRPIDPNSNVPLPPVSLIMPDGPAIPFGDDDKLIVERTRERAREIGAPLSYLVTKASFAPFLMPYAGRVTVIARGVDGDYPIGSLNIRQVQLAEPTASLPTSLPPPAKPVRAARKKKASKP